MKEFIVFFKILFFSKVVLLTPVPVSISKDIPFTLILEKPISAINRGASIEIDITSMIGSGLNIAEVRHKVRQQFPDGSIVATLSGLNGGDIVLYNVGESISKDKVNLLLSGSVPADIEWTKVCDS